MKHKPCRVSPGDTVSVSFCAESYDGCNYIFKDEYHGDISKIDIRSYDWIIDEVEEDLTSYAVYLHMKNGARSIRIADPYYDHTIVCWKTIVSRSNMLLYKEGDICLFQSDHSKYIVCIREVKDHICGKLQPDHIAYVNYRIMETISMDRKQQACYCMAQDKYNCIEIGGRWENCICSSSFKCLHDHFKITLLGNISQTKEETI